MIELIQFPWSPFCIIQRRILEASGTRFKLVNIPNGDRSLVWKISKQRYYGVPVLKDGKAYVQAGGGWVNDSTPEAEYQETVNKAKAMLKAVALAETFAKHDARTVNLHG